MAGTWLLTGVAGVFPLPLAVLVAGLLLALIAVPSWAQPMAVYLSAFALMVRWPLPTVWLLLFVAVSAVVLFALAKAEKLSRSMAWTIFAVIATLPLASLSGGNGSASGWREWLEQMLSLSPTQADQMVIVIRKVIHFSVYGFLAWAAAMSARDRVSLGKSALFGLLWSLSHGAFDELRQSQTPGRTGSWGDFAVDGAGAIFALICFWLVERRKAA